MRRTKDLAVLIERWFTDRLMKHRGVSSNTIASYRDTFRLLFAFAQTRLGRSPSELTLRDLDAPFIGAFLEDLETKRAASVRTRNLRLTAIRSFFRYAAFEEPAHSAHIQRVLAIPSKRGDKRQLQFLTRPEIEAIGLHRSKHVVGTPRLHPAIAGCANGAAGLGDHRSRPRLGNARPRRACAMCRQGPQRAKYAAHKVCAASHPALAQGTWKARRNGSLSKYARWQAQRRRRAGAAEQICRQSPPSLCLPSLKASVAPCLAALRCHGVAAGGRRLLRHCPVVGPRSDGNDVDLSSCASRTEGICTRNAEAVRTRQGRALST